MKQIPPINRLLFIAASGLADEDERRAFLEFACQGDSTRLKRVEALLAARDDAEEFFELRAEVKPEGETSTQEGRGLDASIGPYRLLDRLGTGGCGVVYLAEQQSPVKRKVALKIIRLGMDTENVIARFGREREALALMDHPNIARVLDAGTTSEGRPYFVMELVDGEWITHYCDRKRLGLRERLELFILVCEAIQHAHQKGVIHRDIKPSNILVREHDGRAVPKVIDFGIAKATAPGIDTDSTALQPGDFIGTPAYMSPEQADGGRDVDTRGDIYSLGALLCELLTGQPPFSPCKLQDRGAEEIRRILQHEVTAMPSRRLMAVSGTEMDRIAGERGVDPRRLPHLLAGDLDWIVMKAIEKDRRLRYETANGLAMDVQRHLREEPVLARPPSRAYTFRKLVRRNIAAFAAGSITFCALFIGFGVSTWLFLSEKEARKEQARLRIEAEHARGIEIQLREKMQNADLVTQAAVFVRDNKLAQADALLASLQEGEVPLSLEAADTLQTLANWNLTQGRWKQATERFSALVPVITNVDLTDTDRMSRLMIPAGSAIKEWGEPRQYARYRELAIRRFADSSNPAVAAQVIKVTLLEPVDAETLKSLAPLTTVLETAMTEKKGTGSPYLTAWRQFSLSLLAYRRGSYDAAEYWMRRSLTSYVGSGPLKASTVVLEAMIDSRQGRVAEAWTGLKDARQRVADWESSPFQLGTSVDLWFDWANARILLREAENLIPSD